MTTTRDLILTTISNSPKPLTAQEIMKKTGASQSVAYHQLQLLEKSGLVSVSQKITGNSGGGSSPRIYRRTQKPTVKTRQEAKSVQSNRSKQGHEPAPKPDTIVISRESAEAALKDVEELKKLREQRDLLTTAVKAALYDLGFMTTAQVAVVCDRLRKTLEATAR